MLESKFQSYLINRLREIFDGCIVLKNDPTYKQGIPDLTVLYNDKWATLECKASSRSKRQPNQEYYVALMNEMSFSSFVYPDNQEEVIKALEDFFTNSNQNRLL